MENIEYLQAIHELQIHLTKISAQMENELGSASLPGNMNRRIDSISKELSEVKTLVIGNDSISARLSKIESDVIILSEDLKKINIWKESMERIASIPQFDEMKKEIESQKTKWIVAATIFTVIQIIVGFLIRFI